MFAWLGRIPRSRLARARLQRELERALVIELAPDSRATWMPSTIVSGRPMVQLVAEFSVTNSRDRRVLLVSARLRKPAAGGLVRVQSADGVATSCAVEPFATLRASAYFFVPFALPPSGTTVVADVGFVDQSGGTHWVEKVRFRMGG